MSVQMSRPLCNLNKSNLGRVHLAPPRFIHLYRIWRLSQGHISVGFI